MQKQPQTISVQTIGLEYFIDLQASGFEHIQIFSNVEKSKPWSVLNKIPDYMKQFFIKHPAQNKGQIVGSVHIDQENISIEEGTIIEHGAMIKSPCIIGKNCQIRKGAYLRGNTIIGDNVIIGNSCEIKNSIIFNGCQVPHFNYVGDSILGTKAHLAAGAMTSNFRLDGKCINVVVSSEKSINTEMRKFGAIVGDRAQIGCNVVMNPGSLIGKDSWVYPNVAFRGFLQSNKILKLKQEHIIETKK